MGVKELVAVAGWPDTHASLLYRDEIATRDATEAARLRAAGAVLVGLTTSPEFGSTNWTRSYLHGVTRNPWNPERTPGGSSGGSAAAVASGMMPICTGSDGGGSIRIPSSYSGLFGFKVSFGRVGDVGAFDNALMAVPGPMCRTVRDAARYVDAVAGPTNADPTSLPRPSRPYEDFLLSGDAPHALRGKRVAWSASLGFAPCDPEVEKVAYEAAIALVADAGMHLVDLDVVIPKPSGAWGLLSSLEVSSHHGEAARGRLPTSRRWRVPGSSRSNGSTRNRCSRRCGAGTRPSPPSARCSTKSTCCSRRRPRRRRSRPRGRRRSRSRASASAAWVRCRSPRRSTCRASPR